MTKNGKILCIVIIVMTLAVVICAWRESVRYQTVVPEDPPVVVEKTPSFAPVVQETPTNDGRVTVDIHVEPVMAK